MEATGRLVALLRNVASSQSLRLRHLHRPFSSSAAAQIKISSFDSEGSDGGSSVYRHALKFQRPSTIAEPWWQDQRHNSVSFIGTVDRPLQQTNIRQPGRFGVHTHLKVKTDSNNSFEILLTMWDKLAEISMKHLKQNDLIYVSGRLGSFETADENGFLRTRYKVNVNEINYVTQHVQDPTCQKSEEQSGLGDSEETRLEKYNNRLHLWQVFFASPHEWWDNRKTKKNPKYPDFAHKDTGEALWLNPDDPPWILRQLQLHDSMLSEQSIVRHDRSRSNISPLVYDELMG